MPNSKKNAVTATPKKKLKSRSGKGVGQKPLDDDGSDYEDVEDVELPSKSGGRGRGGRGTSATPAAGRGRGRGAGRGGFMNFGERKDPPNKGQKVNLRIFWFASLNDCVSSF